MCKFPFHISLWTDQFHPGRLSGDVYMHAGGIGADQRLGLSHEAAVPDSCGSGKEAGGSGKGEDAGPVSYTHLDVYKRQI